MNETEPLTIPMILTRLLVAAVIGGLIGYERRMHHKAIGIAGMMLVALGSATYMLLAKHLTSTDPSAIGRLLQGFFSGIGFLGGGIIFVNRQDQVQGLTTAASVWATAAMGIAAGLAHFRLAVGVTVLLAFVLHVLARFDRSER